MQFAAARPTGRQLSSFFARLHSKLRHVSEHARAMRRKRRAQEGAAVEDSTTTAVSHTKETRLVEAGIRPALSADDRDDAKQVLTTALAGIQRERGAADGFYLRGRNFFGITAGLFTAVQAAFVASVGKESKGALLLDSGERADIVLYAAISGGLLVLALSLLVLWLDKPRDMTVVGAETLRDAWVDPGGKYHDQAVLDVLVTRTIQEERDWAKTNGSRKRALRFVAITCALASIAASVELIMLYIALI
jgi:hypothetical protein